PSERPAALVEALFITKPAEALIASDPAGQQKIAEALAAGVLRFASTPALGPRGRVWCAWQESNLLPLAPQATILSFEFKHRKTAECSGFLGTCALRLLMRA